MTTATLDSILRFERNDSKGGRDFTEKPGQKRSMQTPVKYACFLGKEFGVAATTFIGAITPHSVVGRWYRRAFDELSSEFHKEGLQRKVEYAVGYSGLAFGVISSPAQIIYLLTEEVVLEVKKALKTGKNRVV